MTLSVNTGVTYNFNTTAPSILGVSVTSAKLIGIMDYTIALNYDNVDLRWRTIYPLLPSGTTDDPSAYTYYCFQTQSGSKVVYAEPWIDSSTVEVVTALTITSVVRGATQADITRIRNALSALGYTDYAITYTN